MQAQAPVRTFSPKLVTTSNHARLSHCLSPHSPPCTHSQVQVRPRRCYNPAAVTMGDSQGGFVPEPARAVEKAIPSVDEVMQRLRADGIDDLHKFVQHELASHASARAANVAGDRHWVGPGRQFTGRTRVGRGDFWSRHTWNDCISSIKPVPYLGWLVLCWDTNLGGSTLTITITGDSGGANPLNGKDIP